MSPHIIFNLHLVLGYVAWLLCFRAYLLPSLKSMDQVEAHRAIATLHSFRFANEYPFIPIYTPSNDFSVRTSRLEGQTSAMAIFSPIIA